MATASRFTDALSRFVFEHAAARGALVGLDSTCRDILACRAYPPVLRRVLGELLAATALLASTLKFDGSLILQLAGDGPLRMLVVECDAALTLRATAQWSGDVETFPADADLATLAGGPARARLAITVDPKDGGPLYQGIVGLETAAVATLIEHYLSSSEQIASRLVLGADGDRVRGLLVQRLPGADAADAAAWERIAAAAVALPAAELLAAPTPAALLTTRFPEDDIRLFEPRTARFGCGCSAERVGNALRLLGREEVEGILAEQGSVTATCEFCNRGYTFDATAAQALFAGQDDAGHGARTATGKLH